MDKIDKLKELKELHDDNIISNEEYISLKNEILNIKTNPKEQKIENVKTKPGLFKLVFDGLWFLFDVKTKIYINGVLLSSESTKNGFQLTIPIDSTKLEIELSLLGIKSTKFKVEEIDLYKNYTMTFFYDKNWGKYSDKYQITENG